MSRIPRILHIKGLRPFQHCYYPVEIKLKTQTLDLRNHHENEYEKQSKLITRWLMKKIRETRGDDEENEWKNQKENLIDQI